jgi:hypothetical protein
LPLPFKSPTKRTLSVLIAARWAVAGGAKGENGGEKGERW